MGSMLAVFVGGGLGSLARYGIFKLLETHTGPSFPLATLLSNIIACLVLGVFLWYWGIKDGDHLMRNLIAIGFCGGFSTFSTFSLETLELFKAGNLTYGVLNIACRRWPSYLVIFNRMPVRPHSFFLPSICLCRCGEGPLGDRNPLRGSRAEYSQVETKM